MELAEFLSHLTRLIYLAIAILTLFEYIAHRDETRLDIALMFASFAVTVVGQEFAAVTGSQPRWLQLTQTLPLVTQPYLLVRLVGHFRPVPVWVLRLAMLGAAVSWLVLLFQPSLPSAAVAVLLFVVIIYFVWAEAYAAVAFVRGARSTGGVTRWRLTLAALGAGLVAGVIASAGLVALAPGIAPILPFITQPMSVGSALSFYFAFAPPRWLRHTWQLSELHRFLGAASGKPAAERAAWILGVLCDTAMRSVGGRGSLAASWEPDENRFVVRASTNPAWILASLTPKGGVLDRAWREQKPLVARRLADMSPDGQRLSEAVGASSLMVVPIATGERKWGLLMVALRRTPLFPDDDLMLLQLFAEQAGLALEQAALLQEQQALVQDLRNRTAQLEATNAELEAFSYSVSHDLRAPLRHIEGFTDLLQRSDAPPAQQRQHLQRIAEAAVRMGRLIDDLLTFSRMGRAEVRRLPLSLNQLVDELRPEVQLEAGDREIVWHVGALPHVEGDPELLRMAMYNLLANAVKYTRGREPARIEVGAETGQDDDVVVYVKDNGVGFDMQYADKLFGVFQRLHHADEFEGVGIGLANVRRIITRHGGRTWASGQLGRGATFFFSLPKRRVSAPPAPSHLPPAPAVGARPATQPNSEGYPT